MNLTGFETLAFYLLTGAFLTLVIVGLICLLFPIKLKKDRHHG